MRKRILIILLVFILSSFFLFNLFDRDKVIEKNFVHQPYVQISTREIGGVGGIENLFFRQEHSQALSPRIFTYNIIEQNSLRAVLFSIVVSPQTLAVAIDTDFEDDFLRRERREVKEYIVQQGDTLSSIANKFDISLNTILWANNLTPKSLIRPGQKLIILPVSGVIHNVRKNDTLSAIAQKYKADIDEIIAFNELLKNEHDIYVGDILIIPGGKMPSTLKRETQRQIPLAATAFFLPARGRISQGLHWYNAIDIANHCGSPIYAAAKGRVLRVRFSYSRSPSLFGGLGNHLTILHPNGVVTLYAHLLHSYVKPGDEVSQGQIIARMGGEPGTPGAGRTTGCHLHFEVHNARNPFIDLPVGSFH